MNPLKASRTVVVLVRPEFSEGIYGATFGKQMRVGTKRVEPPMALMQLAGALIQAGHEAHIVDGEVENLTVDETVNRICQARPDVVGVTATTPENIAAAQVLRAVKRRLPGVVTVIGGAHATHVPWELADADDAFEYVAVYEGEKAMVAIADGDQERLCDYSDNAQRLLRCVGLPGAETAGGVAKIARPRIGARSPIEFGGDWPQLLRGTLLLQECKLSVRQE